MTVISSKEIRNKFLEFFQEHQHLLIENSSIIPRNDPTLLFINSGMAPLKRYFTGEENPPKERLCNIQPCIRTIDIDEIGDKHHLTSFQMLGSWSINNYFKEGAVSLAFKFLTEYLKIPKNKLYVTVFSGDKDMGLGADEEAESFWEKVGIEKSHIVRCGKDDNFWGPTSDTGPCGPCTEVFYDTGKGEENKYSPGGEFDTKNRYIEIWNAGVFMQFNKNADGSYSKLSFTSVDTGAGLERLSMVINGYSSVYDTDMLRPIKDKICEELKGKGTLPERDVLIMTDHLRTISLILSEKVTPSNEGRGYIPRKLIRKCVMILAKSKIKGFKFSNIVRFITEIYSELYPEFSNNADYIVSEFKSEVDQFDKVLKNGIERLEEIKRRDKYINGEEAFDLVTTYGLPFEIIKEFTDENSIKVDEDDFNKRLDRHRDISRNNKSSSESEVNIDEGILSKFCKTNFCGYDNLTWSSKVVGIVKDGIYSESLKKGEKGIIILESSCMYAESGGQCADKGYITGAKGSMSVENVKKSKQGVFTHIGRMESGTIKIGETVEIKANELRRRKLANNHTSVHLLHSVLRSLYGKDLHQSGSKVEEDRLRFDFNYDGTIEREDVFKIESLVNSYIRDNIPQVTSVKEIKEAIEEGALALFESKYGDKVRVVTFGDASKELCGGTHTDRTGNIGTFIILSAEGIGKGIKRITAVTGDEALNYLHSRTAILGDVCAALKVKPQGICEKLQKVLSKEDKTIKDNKAKETEIIEFKGKNNKSYAYFLKDEKTKTLVDETAKAAEKIQGVAICICMDKKTQIIVSTAKSEREKTKASEVLSYIIKRVGGKGGGNERMASGGTEASVEKILDAIKLL